MTPFTILACMYPGEAHPANFATFTVTLSDLEAIRDTARILKTHTAMHGGYSTLHHCGNQAIDFIKKFPEDFDFGIPADHVLPWDLIDGTIPFPEYAAKSTEFHDHNKGKHLCHTESTGLSISLHGGVRIRGYCKNSDNLLVSDDILPLIVLRLETTHPQDITFAPFFRHQFSI